MPRARRRVHLQAHVLEVAIRRRVRRPERVACPVCGWSGPEMAPAFKPRRRNRLCPSCNSSERYRALALRLRAAGPPRPGARLLEVAPIATVAPLARELGWAYASVDLHSPTALVRGDLCRLPFPDAAFDLVVCLHVLEHIVEDGAAVRELARVVGPDGTALVVVPWDPALPVTDEDPDTPPEERERRYGQSDHVRIYGADVTERWRATGTEVVVVPWADEVDPAGRTRAALEVGADDRWWELRSPRR